ncbi:MAG: DNA methyltransferase [Gammaproteobacteria bacterium]
MSLAVATMHFPAPSAADTLARLLDGDLSFHKTGSGDNGTHSLHPFPAKFPPQLPALFVENLTAPGDMVLDPMMGSGTTLIEAVRLERKAVGCDIDPLSLIVGGAKLSPISPLQIIQTGFDILFAAKRAFADEKGELEKELRGRYEAGTRAFMDYWFLPDTQLELLALLTEIEKIPNARTRRFFTMIFSSVIITKSAGVSLARDLSHTRPHRITDKQPAAVFSEFVKRLAQSAAHGKNLTRRGGAKLKQTKAQKTGLPGDIADLIITSPPYANNAIDYMRAHKFSLVWLGHSVKALSALRAGYIGHDAARLNVEDGIPLPPVCETTVNQLAQLSKQKAAALRRYFCEMRDVSAEMLRLLKPGGACVVVVASSVLSGMDVKTHECIAALGEAAGFYLAGIGVRHIDRDRRMMPARWDKKARTQIEGRMHDEYIIGMVKT